MEELSILNQVKRDIGVAPESDAFDGEIKLYINSTLGTLDQLGAGPYSGFQIETGEELWEEFSSDIPLVNMVKQYVTLSVKLIFDGSTMGATYASTIKEKLKELEWRINVYVDSI